MSPVNARSGHSSSFTVQASKSGTLLYSGKSYGFVTSVLVTAIVQVNATTFWNGLTVEFFKSGSLVDSYSGTGPSVDTSSSGNPVAESILTVTPTPNNCDSVGVIGNFQMEFAQGIFPGPDDLSVQIYLLTSTCS